MKRRIDGLTPAGAYSPGIVAEGRFLFVSGQGPIRDGENVRGTIQEETRITLENVGLVLENAGLSFADVVRCGVYISGADLFAGMNEVYAEVFPEPRPARSTVVTGLVGGIKVEIDCVAVLGPEAG